MINQRIHRFRRRVYPVVYPILKLALVIITVAVLAIPVFAQPVTIGGPVSTTVDAMPWLMLLLQGLGLLILLAVGWFVYGHVKDQNSRNAFLNIAAQAVSYGINVVNGATKEKTMSVNVGSSVVANALKFMQTYGPQAMARFGITEQDAVKMLWSRLPSVDGHVDEGTFAQVIAASKGQVAATGTDILSQIPAIAAEIINQMKHKPSDPVAPAAAAAPIAPAV